MPWADEDKEMMRKKSVNHTARFQTQAHHALHTNIILCLATLPTDGRLPAVCRLPSADPKAWQILGQEDFVVAAWGNQGGDETNKSRDASQASYELT